MRRLLLTVIRILDGTPTVTGEHQRGQSLVEMALITPILIILFMGMVEIGWFANNYLTLLDVTRAGARHGAVQQDERSPMAWDNMQSYVPREFFNPNAFADQGLQYTNTVDLSMPYTGTPDQQFAQRAARGNGRVCNQRERGFYLEVVCIMLASLPPLELSDSNNIDDIIVSGFSLARITDPGGTILGPNTRPASDAGANTHLVVVGRYPTNANECDVLNVQTLESPVFVVSPLEPRDPFDINENGQRDIRGELGSTFTERDGFDPVGATVAEAEKQVGYAYLGQHWIRGNRAAGTGCIGSEWTVAEVEALVNLPRFSLDSEEVRGRLPFLGMVLVEMFWQHEMLLQFPVFNPVVAAFGGDETPQISVWAAFPMPSVEPNAPELGLP